MSKMVSEEMVVRGVDRLPAFPKIVDEILSTLDDPDANLNILVRHVARDPVLTARVFSLANVAANRTRVDARVTDLYTATSLIGLNKLRQTAIIACLSNFISISVSPSFWQHCAATGICAQQLAEKTGQSPDMALVAGLLHDIGQLWLVRFHPEEFAAVRRAASENRGAIEAMEREQFGVDHAQIGGWMAEAWKLPRPIWEAVMHHHAPDAHLNCPLVPLTHVAEVLSNALDLSGHDGRVTHLSEKACEHLGIEWNEEVIPLFGRIDAMSQFVSTFFYPGEA